MFKALTKWVLNPFTTKKNPPAPAAGSPDAVAREKNEADRLMRRAAGYNIWQLRNHIRRNRVRIRRTSHALREAGPEVSSSVLKPRLRTHLALDSALLKIYASRVLRKSTL